tara:strand:- start:3290 stop:3850 length:561 start_codon:yes stop_codon:yes gene_type:complete
MTSSDKRLFSPDSKNFLSPVGFKFIIERIPTVEFFCQTVNVPEISIGTRTIETRVKPYDLPGDKMTFGDLQLSFMINENMDNYYEVYKWLKGLTNPRTESQFIEYLNTIDEKGRPTDFNKITTDARLLVLNSNYTTVTTAVFMNIFPVSLSGVRFSADPSDIDYVTADATFKYTLMEFITDDNKRI